MANMNHTFAAAYHEGPSQRYQPLQGVFCIVCQLPNNRILIAFSSQNVQAGRIYSLGARDRKCNHGWKWRDMSRHDGGR